MKHYDCMGVELEVGDRVLYFRSRRSMSMFYKVYKEKRTVTEMNNGLIKLDGKNAKCNCNPANVLIYPWRKEPMKFEDVLVS